MDGYTVACKKELSRQANLNEEKKPESPEKGRSGCRRHLVQAMNEFEMIEKLVEKENVSFEEARDALKAVDGDLVEAIVYLERKAKEEAASKKA